MPRSGWFRRTGGLSQPTRERLMTLSRTLVLLSALVAAVVVAGAACCAYVLDHASPGPKSVAESPEQSDRREGSATDTHVKAVIPRRDPSLVISVQQLLSVEPF